VVEVSGSVVAVPVVGWVPFHPPDAAQVCASFALHCSVVALPMVTLLLAATKVTAGFAVAAMMGSVPLVCAEEDCPQAANAENAAHPIAHRSRRQCLAENQVR
jgi:hypothetical protein